jgi:hypothetical protein
MSPASYLTAPPRVAVASIARNLVASIAAMLVLIAILVAVTLAGIGFIAVRGLQLWRTFKAFGRALDDTTSALTRSLERLGTASAGASAAPERLDPSLARLRVSLARLAVLRSAIQDVQDSVGRLTAVYPRK